MSLGLVSNCHPFSNRIIKLKNWLKQHSKYSYKGDVSFFRYSKTSYKIYTRKSILKTQFFSKLAIYSGISHANQPCECGFRKSTLPINMFWIIKKRTYKCLFTNRISTLSYIQRKSNSFFSSPENLQKSIYELFA